MLALLATIASAIASSMAFFRAVESCAILAEALRARSSLSRVELGVRTLVAIGRLSALRRKISSDFALEGPWDGVHVASVGDGNVRTGLTGQLRGSQLGAHSSRTQLALPVADRLHVRGQLTHRTQQSWPLTIGKIESVNVGEQQQPVGLHRSGKKCAQLIVVAEGSHQLADRDAVILV